VTAVADATGCIEGPRTVGCGRVSGRADRLGLPCLPSEQLNQRGGKTQRQAARRLIIEVGSMAMLHGIERLGFLTFTFADDVRAIKEAQRRFNSLNSHAMKGRYLAWVAVVQRHRDGRIHLHLVVVCKKDIRTGFDFAAIKRRDYCSACTYLRAEWSFWRKAAPKYGFGRTELLPVRTDLNRFGAYVARYLAKQYGTRREERGARLVRYSKGWRTVHGRFSWVGDRDRKIRADERLKHIFQTLGVRGEWDAAERWGNGWKRHFLRLMYCNADAYLSVLSSVDRWQEICDAILIHIEEAFAKMDVQTVEWAKKETFGQAAESASNGAV
jgi:hypothetical protein